MSSLPLHSRLHEDRNHAFLVHEYMLGLYYRSILTNKICIHLFCRYPLNSAMNKVLFSVLKL